MKNGKLKWGFEKDGKVIALDCLLPTKVIEPRVKSGRKYAAIVASISEIGLVEPPVVYPAKGGRGKKKNYVILDGHARVEALKSLGHDEVFCLISKDDEGFTYNHKVNRLAVIQEHFMIVRAIDSGVSEERIAKALDVDVAKIVSQRDLLKGICPEAVDLLRERPISASALRQLRKVKPVRQVEIAELLVSAGNYSSQYVSALVLATPAALVEKAHQPAKRSGITPDELDRMQREMQSLQQGIREVEGTYGPNMMNLVLVRGYLEKLLSNARVKRTLSKRYPEILGEFEKIVEASSLEG